MRWNKVLIRYWCEHYYPLRDYELLPFERQYITPKEIMVAGTNPSLSPYEETCDLNWEFDKALKKLGEHADLFKLVYLDMKIIPSKGARIIYNEFCKLLMEADNGVET